MKSLEKRLMALESARQSKSTFGNWPNIQPDSATDSELAEIERATSRPVWRESDPAWAEIFLG